MAPTSILQNLTLLTTLSLSLIPTLISAQDSTTPSPTPTTIPWTTLSIDLPYPFQTPLFSLSDASTAVLRAFSPLQCGRGGRTSFASTTTVTLPLDCQGAETLSFSTHVHPGCPMGITHTEPATVDWVTATPSTRFAWSCAASCTTTSEEEQPTEPAASTTTTEVVERRRRAHWLEEKRRSNIPDLSSNLMHRQEDDEEEDTCGQTTYPVPVLDTTVTLPLPTLATTETPPELPLSLSAIHHADGRCSVQLSATPVTEGWRTQWCSNYYQYPTSFETTITNTIGVECDGCRYVWGGNMGVRCPQGYMSLTQMAPEETSPTSTLWIYDCVATGEAGGDE